MSKEERKKTNFIAEDLGSATMVSLDGRTEGTAFVTEGDRGTKQIPEQSDEYTTRGAPWGRLPSLKEMTTEVGIKFEEFISSLDHQETDEEIARKFNVPVETITHLRDHFDHYGVDSMMGMD